MTNIFFSVYNLTFIYYKLEPVYRPDCITWEYLSLYLTYKFKIQIMTNKRHRILDCKT